MSTSEFYVTGGTLRADAPSYVERATDRELLEELARGEFCYVLTSRQMGKSSLMIRTARQLQERGTAVAVLDLTAVGQNVTPEQWYDGLALRMGAQLRVEDDLEDFWQGNLRLGPCQRWFAALESCVLPALESRRGSRKTNDARLVVFIDELDAVTSLPFATEEFFAALRELHSRSMQHRQTRPIGFCLLGVAAPHELMKDPKRTPFSVGRRIVLQDFTSGEAAGLLEGLKGMSSLGQPLKPEKLLDRVLFWTAGHPYLSQRLCRAVADSVDASRKSEDQLVDGLCEELFLHPRAGETDDNMVFVRERLLRTHIDLFSVLELYSRLLRNEEVKDDPESPVVSELLLAGVARLCAGKLVPRNRIYQTFFDLRWVEARKPVAELHLNGGARFRIKETCSIGRVDSNDIRLPDVKVSRRHALVRKEGVDQLWLVDLGSRNGTSLNGQLISRPMLLRDRDLIEIGGHQLAVHQPGATRQPGAETTNLAHTVMLQPGQANPGS